MRDHELTGAIITINEAAQNVQDVLTRVSDKINTFRKLNKKFPEVHTAGAAEFSWDWIKTNESVIAALDAEGIEAEDLRGLISLCVYHSMKVVSESDR